MAAMTTATLTPGTAPGRPDTPHQDIRTIGLIGLAHGTSHFFHLLLPPLFPAFIREFGFSYSELGLLVTIFFVVSGIGQALAGFLVDRVGARPVLWAALSSFVAASLAAANAHGMVGLALAAIFAGLGNAPFHPVDFTILNKRVSPRHLGHAFSVHGLTGNLGWAAAPVFSIGLATAFGNWRAAYVGMALVALGVLALVVWQRALLDDRLPSATPARATAAPAQALEHPLAFLRLPSVWLCFSFFFFTTAALAAVQSFASPALTALYGLPLERTAFVVTGYMLCGAVGMVLGGFLLTRTERLERNIAAAMLLAAALLALAGTGWLPAWPAALGAAAAGFGTGLAGPSRDMLIRQAAPAGATGRVYGLVYSGLDLGFALAAPAFGALMDHHWPGAVFLGSAGMLLLGVVAASAVGRGIVARRGG